MRNGMNSLVFSVALACIGLIVRPPGAVAASHDGNWSVLIVTETGDCDRAYRYEVTVAGGRVHYAGGGDFEFGGSVAATGAVKVSIRRGDRGATGAGRLSGQSGSGTWQGVGSNAACAGHWEAERR